jgi:TM2 domain-containing membrane protein YozV
MKRVSLGVLYSLLFLNCIGIAGVHRLYLGKHVSGILFLITFGFLGIGSTIDFFLLPE